MNYLCIDIGGTSIKYAIVNENGEFFLNSSIVTRVTEKENYIIQDIIELIKKIQTQYKNYKLNGICVSSAGVVDSEEGKIIFSGPTIPNYTGTEIKKILEKEFNILCEVENDVNCAGLGEYWKGAGENSRSLVCVTLGTGIGGAIIIDGKLLKGVGYTAGEIGYTEVNGNYIQNIASAKTLIELVNEKKEINGENKKLNGYDIFELAKKGDKICIEAIDTILNNLSISLRNIIYLLNPETIIIGGGITEQKEYLEEKIINKVNDGLISDTFRKTKIKLATKGNKAGMLGALYHFLKKQNKK